MLHGGADDSCGRIARWRICRGWGRLGQHLRLGSFLWQAAEILARTLQGKRFNTHQYNSKALQCNAMQKS